MLQALGAEGSGRSARAELPRTIFGYVLQASGRDQIWLALLSTAVFLLTMGPLELQRRIVNSALESDAFSHLALLCGAYGGLILLSGGLKLALNVYRGWVNERAVRALREQAYDHAAANEELYRQDPHEEGIDLSIVLAEVEPVGGFVGVSISEPLMQAGTLISVFAYMVVLQPLMALFSFALFSLQIFFVPRIQRAINRQATTRIQTLREVSGGMIDGFVQGQSAERRRSFHARVSRVLAINMRIYWLKFTMNFLMNAVHHLGIIGILLVGGWYVMQHQISLGTVVAFISGLKTINEPWGDLVDYYRELMVAQVKYGLIAGVLGRRAFAADLQEAALAR
jgi:ABC-type multidrug transport system fused ATPase/permease subunit